MKSLIILEPRLVYAGVCALLGCIVAIVYLLFLLIKKEQEKQVMKSKYQEIEDKYNRIELENLDSRLNPHLFKNILNSVQSHAYQTYFALDKLSNVLDYILYDSRKNLSHPGRKLNLRST